MTCERLSDWLAGDSPACRELPSDLRQHVDVCPECRAVWQGVQNLRREAETLALSGPERVSLWNDLQRRRQAAMPQTAPQGSPASLQSRPSSQIQPGAPSLNVLPSADWSSWLSNWLAPALAFGVVLLVGAWFGLRDSGPLVMPPTDRPHTVTAPTVRQPPAWAMLQG
ncbi:MAG TPA: hypothetical protein PKO06_20200, partial [Candidatus Ozemobacteraceae bacterium]|nr:hypothetical protein [Candidatus Ozemobacteraceae bacterium]